MYILANPSLAHTTLPSLAHIPSLAHTHTYFPLTCAHILRPLPNKAMGYMLSHY